MSNLLEPRDYYKPFAYPWAYDAFRTHAKMHWLVEEVPLSEDVKEWNTKLTKEERNLLTQLFRFFTQGDVDVANAYTSVYLPIFGKTPEVRMMLTSFADREGEHVAAYSALIDELGLPEIEYKAFLEYEAMADKHNYIKGALKRSEGATDIRELIKSIAIYSAFTEGMQLFSSFAMLLSFQNRGLMRNMGTIVEWSIKDESEHVAGLVQLARTLIEENIEVWDDELRGEIYEIARQMVDSEDKFIDLAFELGDIEGLLKEDVKGYVRFITDRRLLQLGMKPNFGIKENPLPWLNDILGLSAHDNFFEKRSVEYTKGGIIGSREVSFPL
jgi:ribonucleoside-diphosphate reductase beta chain